MFCPVAKPASEALPDVVALTIARIGLNREGGLLVDPIPGQVICLGEGLPGGVGGLRMRAAAGKSPDACRAHQKPAQHSSIRGCYGPRPEWRFV